MQLSRAGCRKFLVGAGTSEAIPMQKRAGIFPTPTHNKYSFP